MTISRRGATLLAPMAALGLSTMLLAAGPAEALTTQVHATSVTQAQAQIAKGLNAVNVKAAVAAAVQADVSPKLVKAVVVASLTGRSSFTSSTAGIVIKCTVSYPPLVISCTIYL